MNRENEWTRKTCPSSSIKAQNGIKLMGWSLQIIKKEAQRAILWARPETTKRPWAKKKKLQEHKLDAALRVKTPMQSGFIELHIFIFVQVKNKGKKMQNNTSTFLSNSNMKNSITFYWENKYNNLSTFKGYEFNCPIWHIWGIAQT